MALWIIQAMGCTIRKPSICHPHLHLQHHTIFAMHLPALFIDHWDINSPVLPISPICSIPVVAVLGRELWHLSCRKGIIGSFEVSGCIVIDKNMVIIGIVL